MESADLILQIRHLKVQEKAVAFVPDIIGASIELESGIQNFLRSISRSRWHGSGAKFGPTADVTTRVRSGRPRLQRDTTRQIGRYAPYTANGVLALLLFASLLWPNRLPSSHTAGRRMLLPAIPTSPHVHILPVDKSSARPTSGLHR